MKCKMVFREVEPDQEPGAIVEVKLHRHTIEIIGLIENDAMELEELLTKAIKIKVRRYENGTSKKV